MLAIEEADTGEETNLGGYEPEKKGHGGPG
jgi:hypothetical protein